MDGTISAQDVAAKLAPIPPDLWCLVIARFANSARSPELPVDFMDMVIANVVRESQQHPELCDRIEIQQYGKNRVKLNPVSVSVQGDGTLVDGNPAKTKGQKVRFYKCHHAHNPHLKKHLGDVGVIVNDTAHLRTNEYLVELPQRFNTDPVGGRWWIKNRYLEPVKEPT